MSSSVLTAIKDAREQLQDATDARKEAKQEAAEAKRERIGEGEPESVGESVTVLVDEFAGLCADFRAYMGTFGGSTRGIRSTLGNLRDAIKSVDEAAGQLNEGLDGDGGGEPMFDPDGFDPLGAGSAEDEADETAGFDPWTAGESERGR